VFDVLCSFAWYFLLKPAPSAQKIILAIAPAKAPAGATQDDDSHDDHYRLSTLQPIGEILKVQQ
jgi:hypothetical protein